MKRWIARRLLAAVFAACGIGASMWAEAQPGALQERVEAKPCGNWNDCGLGEMSGVAPHNGRALPSSIDIPMTVVGVYGLTTLNTLSSGPFMLLKWPDGCCPEGRRWRPAGTGQNHAGEGQHVNFLWPAL
ncbi:hypothetical protein [Paraburkholderia saeva]|uniref:Uncharacterized protein n=1 Tax=Paraburkholderia saeva TaxID=2777537 RepID=A0A9N8X354_9BURK|nr:hypothetical protein [Paraburkholderia saeva]CAG4890460.1 hypothetical protein R70241_01051 [Paraburkholderia saeva]CAG4898741.1 hypothetical protein R52603_02502 [Paraburkholderia saeva]CAG4911049.1 hypothetical protein LMG31841_04026 [Paraburkholderia saeva]